MSVVSIKDAETYNKLISSPGVSVVLFSADWAEQCAQILNVMNELAKQDDFKVFKFLDVPAEDFSEVSMKHQVEAVPTVIFFRSGSAIDRIDGVNIAQLTEKCRTMSAERPAPAGSTNKGSLEDRLKALINKADIMCFVKGDKTTPRCGFSKQLIAIMNESGKPYETFDILTDEEVRQGLKTYSDWPTYPQVYVKGELVGGLDIIKETLAAGELEATLSGSV